MDLLVFLGRRIAGTRPCCWSPTGRRSGRRPSLRAVAGRLPPEAVRRLHLEPLSEAAVAELARRAGRPAAGLRALTAGTAAGHRGPGRRRRRRAPDRPRPGPGPAGACRPAPRVVRLVAVVPTRAELWLLEGGARAGRRRRSRPGVGRAAGAGPAAVGFRHECSAGGRGSLPALARRELNRRVWPCWPASPAARSTWPAGPPRPRGRRRRRRAAVRARGGPQAAAVAAHREAVGHYRRCWPRRADPPGDRAELLEGYSVEAYLAGLSREAVTARQAAVSSGGGRDRRSWASPCAGCRAAWWTGDARPPRRSARAIAVLEPLPPGHEWPWPTATRPSSTCSATASRRA